MIEVLAIWVPAVVICRAWERLSHFTWWGVAVHVFMLCVEGFTRFDAWWGTDICVQSVVLAGVFLMSWALECDMLNEAWRDMGTPAYIAGNFLVHYLPFVSAFARREHGKPCRATPIAVLLWLLYNVVSREPPGDVYGCSIPEGVVTAGGALVGAAAALLPCAL